MDKKEYLHIVGIKIRQLRIKMNFTQDELAKKMGYVSRSTINKIEKGLVDIPQSKLIDFANILGVLPVYFLDTTEFDGNKIVVQLQNGAIYNYNLTNEKIDIALKFLSELEQK